MSPRLPRSLNAIPFPIKYIANGKIYSNEPIEGRINDAINYLFLLRCLIKDLQKDETNVEGTFRDGKKN